MKFLSSNSSKATFITCLSTFILGYINAYSLLFENSSLVSPQTGNLVNLGIKLSQGFSAGLLTNLMIFSGFGIGCFLAPWLLSKVKNKQIEFFLTWTVFVAPIWINLLFINTITPLFSILLLSFVSGVGLCFFRKINQLDLNNNIMTGNLKNMYAALFEVTILKKVEKYKTILEYALIIFLFFIGTFIAGLLSSYGAFVTLVIIVGLSLVPYLFNLKALVSLFKQRKDVNNIV
ncbi:YoaK family protein [Culicoidibacter larvae]|uniref:DUF1275 domain-containing protein n=1 Tax=Culicoidibacter larvae TaxID=2579976 RepID=A0A5R8QHJ0_9FIRM|nr:YoaK family protein [Culicoidibacter larvae]TLG77478.1 DUF1275 domain-containing protein [Culicoidibacter larvae]